ncbi:MAG: A/G-specific adenine glycosylase [Lachnospiraceae bacterium]|nr:A/G-specific adenine glycosylase [Lachnospiraceae bacterium]
MKSEFIEPLRSWYKHNGRDLPWRHSRDPYRIWISEIMLQQTRVQTVIPYYQRFLKHLPNTESLAACPEEKLLKLWEGLGYYSRARNMKKAAEIIAAELDGHFPETAKELLKLPGIGSYTSAAIASIAFGEAAAAVDGNVLRVAARLSADERDILNPRVRSSFAGELSAIGPREPYAFGELNQAFMDLGSMICLANAEPKCAECPICRFCEAKKQGRATELPVRVRKTGRKKEKRTVFIFKDGEKIAVRKRPEKGLLAGLFEFPNEKGFLNRKEALEYTREKGLFALTIRELPEAKHIFSHTEWEMIGYEIRVPGGSAVENGCLFAEAPEIEKSYPIPSAFAAYAREANIRLFTDKGEEK